MSRRAVSAIAVLAALILPAGASGAVLETLTVPAGATEVTTGKVVLKEGTTYTLKVSGTYEQVGKSSGKGTSYDALFCIGYINQGGSTCSDHHRAANFAITTIPAGPWKDIDAYGGPTQTYFAGHEYTVSFEPPATGVLRAGMSIAYTHCTTCETNSSGAITVQISGPGGGDGATPTKLVRRRPTCGTSSGRALLAATPRYCGFGLIGVMDTIEEIYDYEVPSAPLPPKTKKVDMVADVQNPEDDKLFEEFVVAVVKARKRLKDQLDGCMAMGSHFDVGLGTSLHGHATLLACIKLIRREQLQARSAAGSGDACGATFIPAFRKGVKVSRAKVRSARARMTAGVRAKCSRPNDTQIRMQLAGRGGALNPVLGKQVHTAVGTFGPAGAEYGDGARLLFSWGVSN